MWRTTRTQIRWLAALYLILLLASAVSIAAMHILPAPWLSALRIPSYLWRIDSPILIGTEPPLNLLVYHLFLGFYFVVIMGNQFGVRYVHIPAWRRLAMISSVAGIGVFGGTFELFAYPLVTSKRHFLAPIDVETSRIYAAWSLGLLLIDVFTLVLVRKGFQKLAPRDPLGALLPGDAVSLKRQGE